MDRFTAEDGTTYVMDTADRYPLGMARDLLAAQMGRRTAARALFDARFRGPVTIGGTRVAFDAVRAAFTITDAAVSGQAATRQETGK
jgi:hypothetical protein